MIKNTILFVSIVAMLCLLPSTSLMANGRETPNVMKQKKDSPFLVVGKLPHTAKLLMKQWDSPKLNLSAKQKELLLIVRKETMKSVKHIAPTISKLHMELSKGIFGDKTPEDLSSTVQDIADLKSQATMIQLKCIYDSNKILSKEQLSVLLNGSVEVVK